jgi:hypothetical protein
MAGECAGIEVGLAEACADDVGTLEDGEEQPASCAEGGGCMFDVGDLLCEPS